MSEGINEHIETATELRRALPEHYQQSFDDVIYEFQNQIAELEARVEEMRLGGCRGCRELETWHICGKQPDAIDRQGEGR